MLRSVGTALLAALILTPTMSLAAPTAASSGGSATTKNAADAKAEVFPSQAEIKRTFSDRTWTWPNGGGYFASNGTFYGVVGDSAKSAYIARGSWQAGSKGDLCYKALWKGRSGADDTKTCFFHKIENGKLLQKKGAGGTWYTFKSAKPMKRDEINKLVAGNMLKEKMSEVQAKYLSGISL